MPVFANTIRPCEIGKKVEAWKIKIQLKESTHTPSLIQRLSPHLPDSRGSFSVLRHRHEDRSIKFWLLWEMEMPSVARKGALLFCRVSNRAEHN